MPPRIAICFFGITRSLTYTIGSIEQNILVPARERGDVRIFAHFFRQIEIDNPRSGETGVLPQDEHRLLSPDWLELEEPDLCLSVYDFESLKTYGDVWNDGFRSLRNLVHQLHSLDRVTTATLDWRPDICIFSRPDLLYAASFDKVLRKAVRSNDRTVFVPSWQHYGGLNDRFAVCIGTDAARVYGKRIEHALPFAREHSGVHAERLLKHVLASARHSVRRFGIRASRVRSDGRIHKEDFRNSRLVFHRVEKFGQRAARRLSQKWLSKK